MKSHPKSFRLLSAKLKEGKIEKSSAILDLDDDLLQDENDNDVTISSKFDQFKNAEINPYNTLSNKSGLWELYTLQNHFCCKVRKLVKKFEKNFCLSANIDLDTFSKVKETDFMYNFNEKTVNL